MKNDARKHVKFFFLRVRLGSVFCASQRLRLHFQPFFFQAVIVDFGM